MKAVVVGCGSIGTRHLRNLATLGVTQRAVVEPDTSRYASIDADVVKFTNLAEALKWKPDFAVVATPSSLHISTAQSLADAGCHLFIEKPLSHNLDGIDQLITTIERKKLITLVGCNMRFHPGPSTVKTLLDQGIIGPVIATRIHCGSYLPRWRPTQDYRKSYSASVVEGGAVLDCIHELDLACWYSGPATLLHATCLPAQSIGLETDGLAEILLRHDSGILSSVHLNYIQRNYHRSCDIIGTSGTITWDFTANRVIVYNDLGDIRETIPGVEPYDVNQMYVLELAHFLKSINDGTPSMNPVSDARTLLALALEVRRGRLS